MAIQTEIADAVLDEIWKALAISDPESVWDSDASPAASSHPSAASAKDERVAEGRRNLLGSYLGNGRWVLERWSLALLGKCHSCK